MPEPTLSIDVVVEGLDALGSAFMNAARAIEESLAPSMRAFGEILQEHERLVRESQLREIEHPFGTDWVPASWQQLYSPGEPLPGGPPPEHINCRCEPLTDSLPASWHQLYGPGEPIAPPDIELMLSEDVAAAGRELARCLAEGITVTVDNFPRPRQRASDLEAVTRRRDEAMRVAELFHNGLMTRDEARATMAALDYPAGIIEARLDWGAMPALAANQVRMVTGGSAGGFVHIETEEEIENHAIADRRAEELLLSCLDKRQRWTYEQDGYFDVRAQDGNLFRITKHRSFNVYCSNRGDRFYEDSETFCLGFRRQDAPLADQLLMQKMILETDVKTFYKTANRGH